jgi:hypothetical protein
MNYSEISKLIEEKNEKCKQFQIETRKLHNEINILRDQQVAIENSLLIDFLGTENKIEIKGFVHFSGIQINLKKTPEIDVPKSRFSPTLNIDKVLCNKVWTSNFNNGDEIEVIKKNKASVVIRCTKKMIDNKAYNPQSEFRIPFGDFKSFILRDSERAKRFKNWIKRTQSLDSLLS